MTLPLSNQDIPVLLIGYNRPDYLTDRIIELSRMPVKHLFISIDGNSKSNYHDFEPVIAFAKKSLTNLHSLNIDRMNKNLGLVKHITAAVTNVFQSFDHIIVVEDDISLSTNFYTNMIKGFNLQRELKLVGIVGGFSPINFSQLISFRNCWRISKYCSIWGWGCSKAIWEDYNYDIKDIDIESSLTDSKTWNSLNKFQRNLWIQRFKKVQFNPLYTWDIQFQYQSFVNSYQNIYPLSSLVKNIGFMDIRATHTKSSKPKWMSESTGDNRLIQKNSISKFSCIVSKIIDANTVAGDTKTNKFWNKVKLKLI